MALMKLLCDLAPQLPSQFGSIMLVCTVHQATDCGLAGSGSKFNVQ